MSKLLRGALIGCGYFGKIQIEAWRRMEGVRIVAACDPDIQRAEACAPNAYRDPDELLDCERLDFVDVATRPDTHLALVRGCVSRGIPVIVQKPLAPTWEDALELVRTGERAGVRIMAHENWRWQPWHREAQRRVAAGEIGRLFGYRLEMCQADGLGPDPYPNQPYFREMPRLILFESLIHPIDTARFYAGPIHSVYAQTSRRNPLIAGEDRALITITHTAGSVDGIVEGHRYLNPEPPGPAMGSALIQGETGRLLVLATGDVYRDGELVWRNTVTEGYKGDSVRATQQHFVDCLRTGAGFEMDARDYLGSVAAVEAAYRSAAEGRRVEISEFTAG